MNYPSRLLTLLASSAFFAFSLCLFTLAPSHPLLGGELDQTFRSMRFRCVGPFRAGRSLAVASHPSDRMTYYFGATGGGVFKSSDGGDTWVDITDTNFRTSSIGAICIAPSDPNVIYVGTGETDIRGNISMGDGLYRSTDAGVSWSHVGLTGTQAIADIIVHPDDANTVLVSAMGHVFGANSERGIFKSTDGGASWRKVLFRNDSTGGLTLKMDPTNPRIIYASLWQAYRNGWSMSSGGEGSGLYKSTDGGETWKDLTKNPGMPKGIIGKICVDVSPAQKNLVWAMIENANGGLFKSTNGGASWQRTSTDANIRQRPWYFNHVYADPKNADVVYVLNVGMHKSINGGSTFFGIGTNHADHHDMWI
ncbi:MAG: glycosyl hydrolase, partial [Ignavibacteriae bacterium]